MSRTSKLRGLIGEMCKGTKELRGLVCETDVQRKKGRKSLVDEMYKVTREL